MYQNISNQNTEFDPANFTLSNNDDQNSDESCQQEKFYSNYFTDNFLGIYFKVYQIATIFLR